MLKDLTTIDYEISVFCQYSPTLKESILIGRYTTVMHELVLLVFRMALTVS